MVIGFIGLGRMGRAMVLRLLEQGMDVVVYNRTHGKVEDLIVSYESSKRKAQSSKPKRKTQNFGSLIGSSTIQEFIRHLQQPRVVWLMVPEGQPVDDMIMMCLETGIEKGDIIIDGGNSFYKDSIRRYQSMSEKEIYYLDVGTSGGLAGARNGACLMVGGDKEAYEKLIPLFEAAAMKDGYAYFGPAGAGHFVKMVHNGVEYGMLQAIGEGFALLEKGPYKIDLSLVAHNWNHGSVVRGWLMELLERALLADWWPAFAKATAGEIGGGKTGKWTLDTAKEFGVEANVLEESLNVRKRSQTKPTFAGKVVAALRHQFGGHEVKRSA